MELIVIGIVTILVVAATDIEGAADALGSAICTVLGIEDDE